MGKPNKLNLESKNVCRCFQELLHNQWNQEHMFFQLISTVAGAWVPHFPNCLPVNISAVFRISCFQMCGVLFLRILRFSAFLCITYCANCFRGLFQLIFTTSWRHTLDTIIIIIIIFIQLREPRGKGQPVAQDIQLTLTHDKARPWIWSVWIQSLYS